MPAFLKRNQLMRTMSTLETATETIPAGKENIDLPGDDGILDSGVARYLLFVQDGREESHLPYLVGPADCYIGCYSSAVTQTCYRVRGDRVCRIDMVYEIAYGLLQLVLMTQFAVVGEAFPEITMINRPLFERPFIAIGHDENHGFASAFRYHFLQRICHMPFLLP